jgi:predicted neuraminidase
MKKIVLKKYQHIFAVGQETYPQVHASTLELLPDGTAVAAWFGGTEEGAPDVRIRFSKRMPDGTWRRSAAVTPDNGIQDYNPVLLSYGGRLILWYKEGQNPRSWKTYTCESTDGGETWDEVRELVPGDFGGRGPVKDKPVVLSNGDILAGASIEDRQVRWHIFADRSSDGGKTWESSGPIPMTPPYSARIITDAGTEPEGSGGLIQPTVWEHPACDGRVSLFARSSWGAVYRSDSADFGRTWSVARPTAIPNNNSGLDAVMTDSGMLALIYNPVGRNWGPRSPLVVSLSPDNGETFCDTLTLEKIPGEFSYPAIIARGDKLYMTYTWNRVTVAYAEAEIVDAD